MQKQQQILKQPCLIRVYGVYDEQKIVDIIHIRHRRDVYR
jgi:hypothetical protein